MKSRFGSASLSCLASMAQRVATSSTVSNASARQVRCSNNLATAWLKGERLLAFRMRFSVQVLVE